MSNDYKIEKTYKYFLFIPIIALPFLQSCSLKSPEQIKRKNPNVVIIFADDLGYGDLGCYGSTKISTPIIDSLSKNGIIYTDVHAAGSVSQPSRYGILTGSYYWESEKAMHALENRALNGYMPEMVEAKKVTIAEVFHARGYQTAMIGKWHLGATWQSIDGNPLRADGKNADYKKKIMGLPTEHGFDSFFGIMGSHGMPPYCFIKNDKVEFVPTVYRYCDKPSYESGMMDMNWKDEELGLKITNKSTEFIRNSANKETPFFLFVSLSAPHTPYTPSYITKGKSEAGLRGDMVMEVDWSVGEIVNTLKVTGQYDDTIILITSDNGAITNGFSSWAINPVNFEIENYAHQSNGYLRGQKGDTWEGGHRVPMIISWKSKLKGTTYCNQLICHTDIIVTFSDLLGYDLPVSNDIERCSFLPTLNGSSFKGRNILIHHAYRDDVYSIRTPKWKYIDSYTSGGFMGPFTYGKCFPNLPPVQLYDMEYDPIESQNLYAIMSDTLQLLKKKMDELISKKVPYDKTK